MKSGTVLLIGRPNTGKSTLVNNLIGQKVAITSPKAQTTRFPIEVRYRDERGQIIFIDTPGVFNKAHDALSKKINKQTTSALSREIDAVIYLIDHTRSRDFEEAKVLGMVRKLKKPTIVVINKIDLKGSTYLPQYQFLEDEFGPLLHISALRKTHLKTLLTRLFEYLPEGRIDDPLPDESYTFPAINIDSRIFLSELIREKIFLKMRREVPYTTTVVIDELTEKENNLLYIKARIITTGEVYKKMLIGRGGRQIKQIGSMARRELELATNRKVYLDLVVEEDPAWIRTLIQ